MKKKNIILFLIILAFVSCNLPLQRNKTPKEFTNTININPAAYEKDRASISADLKEKLKNHEESFTNSEYNRFVQLSIARILYDSSFSKIAVFVISKIPTENNEYSHSKIPFYYNGNCYLGKRTFQNDSSSFSLKCFCKFSEINFNTETEAITALEDDFFYNLTRLKDEKGNQVFKYNLNDVRFWDSSPGWKGVFQTEADTQNK